MAKKENSHCLCATYFVLLNSPYYHAISENNINKIKKISELGHEIGLHYDSRLSNSGNQLLKIIKKEASLLSTLINKKIKSIAQHDISLSPRFNIKTNEFHDVMDPDIRRSATYLSDSVQNWREGCMCKHIGKKKKIQILTHPIWWSNRHKTRREIVNEFQKSEISKLKKQLKFLQEENNTYLKNLRKGIIK